MRISKGNESKPIRKRKRPAYSCVECRRRKVRCDREQPCNQCTAQNVADSCTYEESPRAQAYKSDNYRNAIGSKDQFQGIISKTRVFGSGHWMNTFALVSF
jgi:hypothetical protein